MMASSVGLLHSQDSFLLQGSMSSMLNRTKKEVVESAAQLTQTDFDDALYDDLLRHEAARLAAHASVGTQTDHAMESLDDEHVLAAALALQRRAYLTERKAIQGRHETVIKTIKDRVHWPVAGGGGTAASKSTKKLPPLPTSILTLYQGSVQRAPEVAVIHELHAREVRQIAADGERHKRLRAKGGDARLALPASGAPNKSPGVESLDWQPHTPIVLAAAASSSAGIHPSVSSGNVLRKELSKSRQAQEAAVALAPDAQALIQRLFHRPKEAATLPLERIFGLEKELADEQVRLREVELKQLALGGK